ncbi:hypothetical protein HK097_008366 [Rhizophlyctis rosea]|uniref:Glyoxalase n=1 Tax=Rhizophlyctis rosea TaxID=64517 RepID=A0AAD5X9A7_9FUNG|nr:hypothetical protein HK097_008366 [Rhizophlyctis rosea]
MSGDADTAENHQLINLVVPQGTLPAATAFYGTTLGLTPRTVPVLQTGRLAWFDIGSSGQQVHVSLGRDFDFQDEAMSSGRHPCFRVESLEKLAELQRRVFSHFERGGEGAPVACDVPGGENSGMDDLFGVGF